MVLQADYVAVSTDDTDLHEVHQLEDSASEPLPRRTGGLSRSTPYGGSVTILADGKGYTYSYGPGGLSGLIHNYVTLGCCIFASIGGTKSFYYIDVFTCTGYFLGLTFGYDQGMPLTM
jgi:hypothetical protein